VNVDPLIELALTFASLSLVAIGGMNSVIPALHQQVVDGHGWLSDAEFANLFGMAQASPGPNGLIVALIGWQVAGFLGFFVATLATTVPPALIAFGMARLRRRLGVASWLGTAQAGLVPIAIGLMLASGLVATRAAGHTPVAAATTIGVALVIWRTSVNPLWLLAAGAALGLIAA
jgi:chromate transporter